MQDQLVWALCCAFLWAVGSSLWLYGIGLLAIFVALHTLEKARRLPPPGPSSLWHDLDQLTLEELDEAVSS